MPKDVLFFEIIEYVGNILEKNLEDIRKDRKNNRWIFPSFPEDDANLPQIVLELTGVDYLSESAENFLGYYKNNRNALIYYRKATAKLRVHILTEKRNDIKYKIVKNNNEYYLYGQKLNTYLTNEIKELLMRKHEKGDLNIAFNKFKLNTIEFNFESNKNVWQSIILFETEVRDYFIKELGNGSIIKKYHITDMIEDINMR